MVPPPAAKPQPQPGRGVLGNPLGGSAKVGGSWQGVRTSVLISPLAICTVGQSCIGMRPQKHKALLPSVLLQMNVQAAMRTSGKPGGSAGPMAKPMKPPSSSQPGGSQGAGHGPAGGRSGGMSAGRGAAGGGGSKGPPGEGSAAAHGAAKGAKVAKPPMRPPIGGEGGAAAAMGAGAGSYGGVGKRLRQQVRCGNAGLRGDTCVHHLLPTAPLREFVQVHVMQRVLVVPVARWSRTFCAPTA